MCNVRFQGFYILPTEQPLALRAEICWLASAVWDSTLGASLGIGVATATAAAMREVNMVENCMFAALVF